MTHFCRLAARCQVWLGGHPAQSERTATAVPSLFKMNLCAALQLYQLPAHAARHPCPHPAPRPRRPHPAPRTPRHAHAPSACAARVPHRVLAHTPPACAYRVLARRDRARSDKLEETFEPIFAMYKTQRLASDEAFGNFCHRVGIPAIEEYMSSYQLGAHKEMPDPFGPELVATDASVGIDAGLLAVLDEQATARGCDPATLLDTLLRDAFDLD